MRAEVLFVVSDFAIIVPWPSVHELALRLSVRPMVVPEPVVKSPFRVRLLPQILPKMLASPETMMLCPLAPVCVPLASQVLPDAIDRSPLIVIVWGSDGVAFVLSQPWLEMEREPHVRFSYDPVRVSFVPASTSVDTPSAERDFAVIVPAPSVQSARLSWPVRLIFVFVPVVSVPLEIVREPASTVPVMLDGPLATVIV